MHGLLETMRNDPYEVNHIIVLYRAPGPLAKPVRLMCKPSIHGAAAPPCQRVVITPIRMELSQSCII